MSSHAGPHRQLRQGISGSPWTMWRAHAAHSFTVLFTNMTSVKEAFQGQGRRDALGVTRPRGACTDHPQVGGEEAGPGTECREIRRTLGGG